MLFSLKFLLGVIGCARQLFLPQESGEVAGRSRGGIYIVHIQEGGGIPAGGAHTQCLPHGALLAVKEPLDLEAELLLLFEVSFYTPAAKRVMDTGIQGRVVREHSAGAENSNIYSYGVEFKKPFSALSR